jgi:hypothetical protein
MFQFRKISIVLLVFFATAATVFIVVDVFMNKKTEQVLDSVWLCRVDSLGRGESEQWFRSGAGRGRWYERELPPVNERHAAPEEFSGIVWYAKTFTPREKFDRTLLSFGGSDDNLKIWINGTPVGLHAGYDEHFSVDISSALRSGENEVVLELISHDDPSNVYAPVTLIPQVTGLEPGRSDFTGEKKSFSAGRLCSAVICEADLRTLPWNNTFSVLRKIIPDLKRSGVTLLCLSPFHPSSDMNRKSGNPLSVQDYYGIGREYGTFDELKSLIVEAHKRGISVTMDFVANGTSWDNVMLMQYPEWYVKNEKGEIVTPYAGVDDVAKLDYERHELQKHMIAVLEYWSDTIGFDGFRCIGSGGIPVGFWINARTQLEKSKPVLLLSQENVPEQQKEAFDLAASFDIGVVMKKILKGTTLPNVFPKLLLHESSFFPDSTLFMRSDRWKNRTENPLEEKESIVFRMTHPGVPVLGAEEICGRPELSLLIGHLTVLRNQHPALAHGKYASLTTNDTRGAYSFLRTAEHDTVIVVMNISAESRTVTVKKNISLPQQWRDVLTEKEIQADRNSLSLELPPYGFAILLPRQ